MANVMAMAMAIGNKKINRDDTSTVFNVQYIIQETVAHASLYR